MCPRPKSLRPNRPVGQCSDKSVTPAFEVGGAVVAVRTRLADLPRIRQTTNAMILLLPASGAAITPIIWWSVTATGPAAKPLIVVLAVALGVVALAGATLLARSWSVRDRRHRETEAAR